MKDGFIKVATAMPNIRLAEPAYNALECVRLAKAAADADVSVLAFPELTISSYTCADLLFQKELLAASERSFAFYMEQTGDLDILTFIGVPVFYNTKLYNCAAAVFRGKLLALIPKTNIPNYNEFFETRYFSPAPKLMGTVEYAGQSTVFGTDVIFESESIEGLGVACEICEDLWVSVPPSVRHAAAGANLIINLSASNETVGKADYRRNLVLSHSARILSAYVYANAGAGESGTDLCFSGHSLIAECGALAGEALPFSDKELLITEVDIGKIISERIRKNSLIGECQSEYTHIKVDFIQKDVAIENPPPKYPFLPKNIQASERCCNTVIEIQSTSLARRLERSYSRCAVIGVSGGLDSTLALIACVRAMSILGKSPRDVIAITMPCFGTTERTKGNAERLCEALGVTLRTIDIKKSVLQHFEDIGHKTDCRNAVYENAQARERTQVLMDVANAEGGIVVGTGDLSELALGFATYNGDHMSMYGVNASVPKTLMRYVLNAYAEESGAKGNCELRDVLRDIINTPISPELLPPDGEQISQCTEDIVGPYELHDYFIYYTVRYGFSPRKIERLANASFRGIYDEDTVRKTLTVFVKRFFSQQFKRSCLPDGPKIGVISLSPRGDFRMPSDASCAEWLRSIGEKI